MDARARLNGIRWTLLWVLGANLAVAGAKALYGWRSGSVAISSDAIHSLLDGSGNVIGLCGLSLSAAPPDRGHPYGHRKFEIVASAAVALFIFAGGYQLLTAAIASLRSGGRPIAIGLGGFATVGATIAVNALVSRAERRAGERLNSPFLVADAQHTASDLLASIAVLVAFVGSRLGLRLADPIGALVVLAFIARVGWRVLRDNIAVLVDAAPIDATRVEALGRQIPGIHSVHRVRSRGAPGAIHVDLHMQVDPTLSVRAAHALAHRLEDRLRTELAGVVDVTIHIEPAGDPEETI
jgi:cation diffusion facilitator family transporter